MYRRIEEVQEIANEIYPQTDDMKIIRNRAYVRGFMDGQKESDWNKFADKLPETDRYIIVSFINSAGNRKMVLSKFIRTYEDGTIHLLGLNSRRLNLECWKYLDEPGEEL